MSLFKVLVKSDQKGNKNIFIRNQCYRKNKKIKILIFKVFPLQNHLT